MTTTRSLVASEPNKPFPGNDSRYQRGLWAEEICQQYYQKLGFARVAHRLRTPFGEVDWVFKREGIWVCVEVKLWRATDDIHMCVKFAQKQRLRRAYEYLLSKVHKNLEFHLVVVGSDGSVQVYEDFLW